MEVPFVASSRTPPGFFLKVSEVRTNPREELMSFLILLILATTTDRAVEATFIHTPPTVDGIIEEVWQRADSAYDFVQIEPYERQSPTEKTVVYVLQDHDNLYFAFRCWAHTHPPTACLTADEDHVSIGVDPFGSKTTAYFFRVFASGIIHDGWILDDGRTYDDSWDGVWHRGVRVYDDHFDVEIKIPYKSIRYRRGLKEWGLQFMRYSACDRETNLWTDVSELESELVSKWGTLTAVKPQSRGYYFELFPEGFLRYDKNREEKERLKPRVSLNFKWDLTSEITLNATAYPDFAHIESDPFTLNLSRYPTYLSERRPFFLEGMEIFRMSDFGEERGFFSPLNIFYSRRIGKSVDGEAIPIVGGMKLTNKSEDWSTGVLAAYTGEYRGDNDSVYEPKRAFGVVRTRHSIFENSDAGILLSGTVADRDQYSYAAGLDGVYRSGVNQLILQAAFSENDGKRGWAASSGYSGIIGNFLTMCSIETIQDSFDVTDIGFVPWAGRRKYTVISGPLKTYEKGFLRTLYVAPGIVGIREPGEQDWSTLAYLIINPEFRNQWGFSCEVNAGPAHEADTNYFHRNVSLSAWATIASQFFNFGTNYGYSYNYRREFLAHQAGSWFRAGFSPIQYVSLSLRSNLWIELDTLNTVLALTTTATPRVDCRINADMSIALFNEFVVETPGTNFEKSQSLSNRIGFLFSWNFSPKSWFYFALNDFRIRDDDSMSLENRIGALKVKYLIYF